MGRPLEKLHRSRRVRQRLGTLRDHIVRKEASFVSVVTAIGLATTALGGGMYVGALANDVNTLKQEKDKVELVQRKVQENSEALVAVQTKQSFMLAAQVKQDKKLDKILEKLEDL